MKAAAAGSLYALWFTRRPCTSFVVHSFPFSMTRASSSKASESVKAKRTAAKKARAPPPNLQANLPEKDSNNNNNNGAWYEIFTKGDEEYNHYMRTEWGFEKHGDQALFEKMSLEGAQSGLSWLTILRKRQAYRRAFHDFDIDKVAAMTAQDVEDIVGQEADNPRDMVVRHRGKIESVIGNAQKIVELRTEFPDHDEPLDHLLWSFVQHRPILNRWNGHLKDAPTQSAESQAMSKELKRRGFRFVGPTTCYAMMQAVGMVIDHPVHSPEYEEAVERLQNRELGYQEQPL